MRKAPENTAFAPVGGTGASEAIVRRVGELIGSGELRPGDRLPPEVELADSFQVAPMTVRTALQVLRENHLIETRRGRGGGTFVRTGAVDAPYFRDAELPSVEEFEDFTVWRMAVSGEACARLAERFATGEIADADRQRLLDLTDASHRSDVSVETFRLADADLHRFMAQLSGSARLLEAERSIQAYLTRTLRHLAKPVDTASLSGQAHSALVAAIVAGHAAAAREELKTHVRSTLDLMVGVGYLGSHREPE
ncbi:GntR family transcriptional regulator [Nonomuraea sp. NBC_01738]|uniref:FadR/GntR family transcriptional regulator n=1 Tax=Nonomuraea sp. NBC_01738 TaxID=2976003 RepID=UPI002E0FEDD1|nr:GntR family transcriptional regulator [Nonomuraea sp. NBC_01738]